MYHRRFDQDLIMVLHDTCALKYSTLLMPTRIYRHLQPRQEAHNHKVQRISRLLIFKVLLVLVLDWYSLQYFRWIVLSLDRYSALFELELAPCSRSVSKLRQQRRTCCSRACVWPTWASWHHKAARRLRPHQHGSIEADSGEFAPLHTMMS